MSDIGREDREIGERRRAEQAAVDVEANRLLARIYALGAAPPLVYSAHCRRMLPAGGFGGGFGPADRATIRALRRAVVRAGGRPDWPADPPLRWRRAWTWAIGRAATKAEGSDG